LAAAAKEIPDSEADAAWQAHRERLALGKITPRALRSALKIYLAVKREVDQDPSIRSVGINCLNESHFSDTTPCLAWELLHEEIDLTWGCEADLVSMLTMHIVHKTLGCPIMMTNLYPFLMGQAALKHEHIPEFPQATQPENHLLLAHCGYLGVLPRRYATEWALREKVLAIVDDNATAIDARLPTGALTLAKLLPDFARLSVVEAELEGYAQYPGSHCLNGAVVRVPDGPRLLDTLTSHHYALLTGHHRSALGILAKVFKLEIV
jgi:L-fucose isomerase-like protein